MSPQSVLCKYNVLTPFGIGLNQTIDAILADQCGISRPTESAYGEDFPVPYWGRAPWDELGYNPENEISKSYFVADQLIGSIRPFPEDFKLDAVFALIGEFSPFEFIAKSRSREFTQRAEIREVFDHRDILRDILFRKGFRVEQGEINFINNTCSTGISMLGFADQGIRHLGWKRVLLLAIDLADPLNLISLNRLGALSVTSEDAREASRPFDRARTGFVKTDGAAVALVVSSEEAAEIEDRNPLIRIRGFCQTADAFRLTDGRDDAAGALLAMKWAIERSGLLPKDIGFVKSHGTGTKLNDAHEAHAIKVLFSGESAGVPVTSLKGHLGHTTDCSGLLESVLAGYFAHRGLVLPMKNLTDPEFDLNFIIGKPGKLQSKYFLSNNFGFGGNNTSIVLEII